MDNASHDVPNPVADALRIAESYLRREASPEPTEPIGVDAAEALPIALSEQGVGEEAALARLAEVVTATPTTSGTRFVNQLFAGRERVATAAETLTALLNTSMYTFKAAGVQTLIERVVIERMLGLAGMPGGDGMFTPGGSLSNLAAMIVARNEMTGDARERGFDGRNCVIYTSEESHYSVRKGANMLGVGRGNVRTVAADEQGRMIPDALHGAIHADREAGKRPMMIVATSGTTVMGAFDPIDAIADVAEKEKLWLHVDGAFGGTALLHPRGRDLLAGLGRADSFTWDAHKMMGVPLICSVVLTREAGLMRKHFDESASYLFQQDFDTDHGWLNPGTRSLQCGRRNDALKLWAQWQALGDAGYQKRVGHQLALARYAAGIVRADERLRLSFEPAWINVCFEVAGKPSDAICQRLYETGLLSIGHGIVKGRRVVRLVTANPAHTEGDIERMFADILNVAEKLPAGDNAV